jgi:hypothetical protein
MLHITTAEEFTIIQHAVFLFLLTPLATEQFIFDIAATYVARCLIGASKTKSQIFRLNYSIRFLHSFYSDDYDSLYILTRNTGVPSYNAN